MNTFLMRLMVVTSLVSNCFTAAMKSKLPIIGEIGHTDLFEKTPALAMEPSETDELQKDQWLESIAKNIQNKKELEKWLKSEHRDAILQTNAFFGSLSYQVVNESWDILLPILHYATLSDGAYKALYARYSAKFEHTVQSRNRVLQTVSDIGHTDSFEMITIVADTLVTQTSIDDGTD